MNSVDYFVPFLVEVEAVVSCWFQQLNHLNLIEAEGVEVNLLLCFRLLDRMVAFVKEVQSFGHYLD